MQGGFAINEWLRREGLLTLKDEPRYEGLVPFEKVEVDWERTVAWAAGGYYARVFLNVLGREPSGVVPPEKYESTRNRLKEMIEGIPDDQGRRMGSVVYKPEELYRDVRNVAPDLMVYLDSLRWRAIGSFGLPSIYVHENDLGPDDANHAQNGVFILWDPRHKYSGQFTSGLQLMDVAPTIMESLGFAVPAGMQGKPVARQRMVGCG
jgi:predicted AlkP superfamily phosphohydrolase/phosphomutase